MIFNILFFLELLERKNFLITIFYSFYLPTKYSKIRSHPIIQAISSPNVAYAYVYADPEAGIMEESSEYDKAAKLAAIPEIMKEITTAGPAFVAATSPFLKELLLIYLLVSLLIPFFW
jgi:hypothetical protein